MKLWPFATALVVCVVALIGGLLILKGPQTFTLERIAGPRLPVADYVTGDIRPGARPEGGANEQQAEVPPAAALPAKVPTFEKGPGTPPPAAKLYGASANTSPEQLDAYRRALDALTVIGCSGNKVALKIDGQGGPKTVSSGTTLRFAGGLDLALRIIDRSACRIVLSDHAHPIGEVASF